MQELQGDLCSQLLERFRVKAVVTDSGISFTGSPDSVPSARAEVETLLACFQQMRLSPSSPVLSFLPSFKRKLQKTSIKACVLTLMSECPCLCAFSSKDLKQAIDISTSALCELRLDLPVEGTKQVLAGGLTKIEREHFVSILVSKREMVVRGFVESDVDSAYKELGFLVDSNFQITRPLNCPPSIHDYLGVVYFGKKEPSQKDINFLNSLPIHISYANARVVLKGSVSSVQIAEEQMLKYLIPNDLHQGNIQFTCNHHFVSQIERSVLSRLHTEHKFVHTVSKHEEEPPIKGPSSGTIPDESYTFSVFSRNKEELEEVCAKMKVSHAESCTNSLY